MSTDPVVLTRDAGRHIHRFHGGLRLRHNKKISCTRPVERPPLPAVLTVPLQQHPGPAVTAAVVAPGQHVLKGDPLGRACTAGGVHVHAPTSGTVLAVEERPMSHPSGRAGMCVVLRADGEDRWGGHDALDGWPGMAPESLLDRICRAGIVGLGGAVFPTHEKARLGRRSGIHTLILNGSECEPYISCDEMLMREKPDKIVSGAQILQYVSGAERTVIAIEDQMGAVRHSLQAAIDRSGARDITVARVPAVYPEGGERQLIQVLTGREVPSGRYPTDIGLACQNVGTAAAVADAVLRGRPLIERYVTVTGKGVRGPRNLLALIGTPVEHLVRHCGGFSEEAARVVIGGPMMGYALRSASEPVVKAANCVLVLTRADIAPPQPEMPCIRCGECARVCPAMLLPQQLHWQVTTEQWEDACGQGLKDCIECGCCDFVCPSHIPLTGWFRYGKGELQVRALEREVAGRARSRHESRGERLTRLEREKHDRLARRKPAHRDRAQSGTHAAPADGRSGKGPATKRGNGGWDA